MLQVVKHENRIRFRFNSEFALIPSVVATAREAFSFPSAAEWSRLSVVMRELLMNALDHGNQRETGRWIQCVVEQTSPGRFTVEVEDEGPGFDYRALDMTLPDNPARVTRRGFVLVGALCDRVEFNEKGNRVKAWCAADREETLRNGLPSLASAS
jgi:anti-sigma regulatory factor (Ser/Thr protein kinase)